jgi:hypothetical protein
VPQLDRRARGEVSLGLVYAMRRYP